MRAPLARALKNAQLAQRFGFDLKDALPRQADDVVRGWPPRLLSRATRGDRHTVLPLTIIPTPSETVRVLVGRVELVE